MISVPITQLPSAAGLSLPAYETRGAAGMDLRSCDTFVLKPGEWKLVSTGLVIALPDGYEAQVRPRSGLAIKHGISVLNAPGTIDSDYRGEIKIPLINHGLEDFVVARGDRIAQLVVAPVSRAEWVVSDELSSTERGSGGFGSSGVR